MRTNHYGWLDLGSKRALVRILILPRNFRRSLVVAIFRIKEHDIYQKIVSAPPNSLRISAA